MINHLQLAIMFVLINWDKFATFLSYSIFTTSPENAFYSKKQSCFYAPGFFGNLKDDLDLIFNYGLSQQLTATYTIGWLPKSWLCWLFYWLNISALVIYIYDIVRIVYGLRFKDATSMIVCYDLSEIGQWGQFKINWGQYIPEFDWKPGWLVYN